VLTVSQAPSELGDHGVLTTLVGPLQPARVIVVVTRDDRDEVKDADEIQVRQRTHQDLPAPIEAVDVDAAFGCAAYQVLWQPLDLGDEVVAAAKSASRSEPSRGGWSPIAEP